jgi:prepilin-type N-terminal cleavage/methylation domain-containing protein
MRQTTRGLTLLELLLAAAIMGVVLSAMLQLFLKCNLLVMANRDHSVAVAHVQYVMEEIKNTNFADIWTKIAVDHQWDWNSATINAKGLAALHDESIDTEVSNKAVSGTILWDISVTANWKDRTGTGGDRSITLETLISQ